MTLVTSARNLSHGLAYLVQHPFGHSFAAPMKYPAQTSLALLTFSWSLLWLHFSRNA